MYFECSWDNWASGSDPQETAILPFLGQFIFFRHNLLHSRKGWMSELFIAQERVRVVVIERCILQTDKKVYLNSIRVGSKCVKERGKFPARFPITFFLLACNIPELQLRFWNGSACVCSYTCSKAVKDGFYWFPRRTPHHILKGVHLKAFKEKVGEDSTIFYCRVNCFTHGLYFPLCSSKQLLPARKYHPLFTHKLHTGEKFGDSDPFFLWKMALIWRCSLNVLLLRTESR